MVKIKLTRDERIGLSDLLPFHGEVKFRKIFEETRKDTGFEEEEIDVWDSMEEKEIKIGKNLQSQIVSILENIEEMTEIQKQLYEKLK